MVELQKAQCFFMLAINIAALLLINDPDELLSIRSYQQLTNNMDLMKLVAIAGTLPPLFGLLTLHLSQMRSSFIYCLTLLTFILSSATGFSNWSIKPSDVVIINDNFAPCGGNPSPEKYCTRYGDLILIEGTLNEFTSESAEFRYSTAVFITLFLNQFPIVRVSRQSKGVRWITVFDWIETKLSITPGHQLLDGFGRKRELMIELLKRGFLSSCVLIFQAIGISLLSRHGVLLYKMLVKYLGKGSGDYEAEWERPDLLRILSDSEWNLGQVIAITVLMPSLIEYLYLASRKCMNISSFLSLAAYILFANGYGFKVALQKGHSIGFLSNIKLSRN